VAEKRLGWKQWNGHGRQCHWARGEIRAEQHRCRWHQSGVHLAITRRISEAVGVPLVATVAQAPCYTWLRYYWKEKLTRYWLPAFFILENTRVGDV